jgi:tetratricopeptide (TPR) repeat protein
MHSKIITLTLVLAVNMIFILPAISFAGNGEIFILKGAKLEKNSNFNKAIAEYRKALDENPNLIEVYKSIGNIYLHRLNNPKKAITIYINGLKYSENDYGLHLGAMSSYFKDGDFDNGIKHYILLANIKDSEQRRYFFPRKVADRIIKDMNDDQVMSFCEKYLAINQTDIILREILAAIYKKNNDYKNIRIQYEIMLNAGYNKGVSYFNLAVCEYNLGDYKKALHYLTAAKKEGEDVPSNYFNMIKSKIEEIR